MTEYIVEWPWNLFSFKTEKEALDFADSQWNSISEEDQEIATLLVYEVVTPSGYKLVDCDLHNYMTKMIKDYKEK